MKYEEYSQLADKALNFLKANSFMDVTIYSKENIDAITHSQLLEILHDLTENKFYNP